MFFYTNMNVGKHSVEITMHISVMNTHSKTPVPVRKLHRRPRDLIPQIQVLLEEHLTALPKQSASAIIIPFRASGDNAVVRNEQLAEFLNEVPKKVSPSDIYIVEQLADGRRFNRGALLNCGFVLATLHEMKGDKSFLTMLDEYSGFIDASEVLSMNEVSTDEKSHSHYIFHDVDLIPSDSLAPYYRAVPPEPLHIGWCWDRYRRFKGYFGGVVSMTRDQIVSVNGYGNDSWGWGAEDDVLRTRIYLNQQGIARPAVNSGTFRDLECMTYEEKKKSIARAREENPIQWEQIASVRETWKSNGLCSLCFKVLSLRLLCSKRQGNVYRIIVQL